MTWSDVPEGEHDITFNVFSLTDTDSNPYNNEKTKSFTWKGYRDLVAGSFTVSPDSVDIDELIACEFKVKNEGTGTAWDVPVCLLLNGSTFP